VDKIKPTACNQRDLPIKAEETVKVLEVGHDGNRRVGKIFHRTPAIAGPEFFAIFTSAIFWYKGRVWVVKDMRFHNLDPTPSGRSPSRSSARHHRQQPSQQQTFFGNTPAK